MKSGIEEEYEQSTQKNLHITEEKRKRLPIWQILIIDVLVAGLLINVFAFFTMYYPEHWMEE